MAPAAALRVQVRFVFHINLIKFPIINKFFAEVDSTIWSYFFEIIFVLENKTGPGGRRQNGPRPQSAHRNPNVGRAYAARQLRPQSAAPVTVKRHFPVVDPAIGNCVDRIDVQNSVRALRREVKELNSEQEEVQYEVDEKEKEIFRVEKLMCELLQTAKPEKDVPAAMVTAAKMEQQLLQQKRRKAEDLRQQCLAKQRTARLVHQELLCTKQGEEYDERVAETSKAARKLKKNLANKFSGT